MTIDVSSGATSQSRHGRGVHRRGCNMLKYVAQIRMLDISKAEQRLGYEPRVNIKKNTRRTVAWQLSNYPRAKTSS